METGELIKAARKSRGLTQKQLGDLCGMADSAIRRYESGKGNPTQKTLQRIASALQVDPYSLYSFDQAAQALEERINTQEARERVMASLDKLNSAGMEKAAEAVAVIADGIGDRLKYKAQIAAVMEIITTEGLRIGKDIFEAIAGNPKYRLGPAPDEDR